MRRALIALFAFCLPLAARGGDWAPIPATVWQMKATDPGNELGAVVLDKEIRLGKVDTEYRLRIRIMSEAGKAAASIAAFPSSLYKVEGRTVYADGKVVPFDSEKDFTKQTLKTDGRELNTKIIIPPGLTNDCLVDVHWTLNESLVGGYDERGNYYGRYWYDLVIPGSFPIKHSVVQLSNWSPMASALVGFGAHPPKVEKESAYRVYTFEDVPAFEDIPYSLPAYRERARLILYWQPSFLTRNSSDPKAYWKSWSQDWLRKWYDEDLKTGRKYNAFLANISKDLPKDAIHKAQEALFRIQRNILDVDLLTAEQAKARTKKVAEKEIDSEDLDEAVSRGWTDGEGIGKLTFKVFRDLGLKPKLAWVVDREDRPFYANVPCIFQFSNYLILVPDETGPGMAWLDPANLLMPPGVIAHEYQGTPALEVDPADWNIKAIRVPLQGDHVNQRSYNFDLTFEDGREAFKLSTGFLGVPLRIERDRYYRLEPAEQEKTLKEYLQEHLDGFKVTKTEVHNAQDITKNMGWSVEGGRDLDEGRKVSVDPFPGMSSPCWTPTSWPATRSSIIVFPYALTHHAVSRIHVPSGYKAVPGSDLEEKNGFGSVSWKTLEAKDEAGDPLLTVTYDVVVAKPFGGTADYDAFKTFLAWVDDGYRRLVVLQKER